MLAMACLVLVVAGSFLFRGGEPGIVVNGETLTYRDDGAMVVSGFSDNDRCGGIKAVSRVQDHWLDIHGEHIDLQDRFGAGALIRFDCRYGF